MNEILEQPCTLLSPSLLAELVIKTLDMQGLKFADDPKPLVEQIAGHVLGKASAGATVSWALRISLATTCKALNIDYAFDQDGTGKQ